jgi:hypothetical protein
MEESKSLLKRNPEENAIEIKSHLKQNQILKKRSNWKKLPSRS